MNIEFNPKRSVFFLAIAASLASAFSGCTLQAEEIPVDASQAMISASQGGTVSSGDGALTLDIPAGALLEDTEISISVIALEEAPQELQELISEYDNQGNQEPVYVLQPSGLTFDMPVTIIVPLSEAEMAEVLDAGEVPVYNFIIQSQGQEPEALDDVLLELSLEDGAGHVTAQLDHFSWLVRQKEDLVAELEQVEPKQQVVGSIFTAEAKVTVDSGGAGRFTYINRKASFSTFGSLVIHRLNYRLKPMVPPTSPISHEIDERELGYTRFHLVCSAAGKANYLLQTSAFDEDTDKTIRISITAFVECLDPTRTPTPSPTPTLTLTPSSTPTPSNTPTPSDTPTPTQTNTPEPVEGEVDAENASCRHGPGGAFLYKWGLVMGEVVSATAQNNGWFLVRPEFYQGSCWIWGGLISLEGDISSVPYAGYTSIFPWATQWANPPGNLQKQDLGGGRYKLSWDPANYIQGDDRRGYLVVLRVCRNGLMVEEYHQTDSPMIEVTVSDGCSQTSTATVHVAHQRGYGQGGTVNLD